MSPRQDRRVDVRLFPRYSFLSGMTMSLTSAGCSTTARMRVLFFALGFLRDAVQAAGRLVERLARLEYLGLVVVDGPLVLAFQDVPEGRAGVAMRCFHLARRQRHLDGGGLRLLVAQLLGDVDRGE